MAFNVLDKDRSGTIELSDIRDVYNGRSHPDVIQGKRSEDEVLLEFLQSFGGGQRKLGAKFDGQVTFEEFADYYSNISASIDRDDYFELMIRNSWHISGGEGFAANTSNRRVLVTHSDGRQTVEEVQNDIGVSGSDKQTIVDRLKKQGLTAVTINTNGAGGMDNQFEDRNNYNSSYNNLKKGYSSSNDQKRIDSKKSNGNVSSKQKSLTELLLAKK